MGNSKKHSYSKAIHNTKDILKYMHFDIWGPSRIETHSRGRYFMTLINDYSRKVWVYILKHKDEAFEKFKEWVTEQEIKKGKSVKHLKTDNGLEYLCEEFQEYSKSKGITRHITVPANPQHNGLVERMNMTILEKVRCMLADA